MPYGINLVETAQTRGLIDQLMNSQWVEREITAKVQTTSWQVAFAHTLMELINAELKRNGEEKLATSNHFGVNVRGSNKYGLYVTLYADDLGAIYYYGTPSFWTIKVHENKGAGKWWGTSYKDSNYLAWNDGSGPQFAKEVTHPQIIALEPIIRMCIDHAVKETNYALGYTSKFS